MFLICLCSQKALSVYITFEKEKVLEKNKKNQSQWGRFSQESERTVPVDSHYLIDLESQIVIYKNHMDPVSMS